MGPSMDPNAVLGHRFPESTFEYTERDVALYGLGVGACGDASLSAPAASSSSTGSRWGGRGSDRELEYAAPRIVSASLKALPTFAVVYPASLVHQILSLESLRFDPALLLHGEHYLELFTPSLPTEAQVASSTCVAGLVDKGKSALLEVETESRDGATGVPLALNCATCVLRGAGGFSTRVDKDSTGVKHRSGWRSGDSLPLASRAPQEPPDHSVSMPIPETQALVYRLSGDYNPLHADPSFAAEAGFPRPILHGLCTLGYSIRALLLCAGSHESASGGPELALRRLRCRFLSHVFPGETLRVDIWLLPGGGHSGLRSTVLASVSRGTVEKVVLTATVDFAPVSDMSAWVVQRSAL